MSLDWAKLVSQGRAKALNLAWTPEELEALIALEKEAGIPRVVAADYIRNGITTVEEYKAAVDAKFKPKTLSEANDEALASLAENGATVKKKGTKKI